MAAAVRIGRCQWSFERESGRMTTAAAIIPLKRTVVGKTGAQLNAINFEPLCYVVPGKEAALKR